MKVLFLANHRPGRAPSQRFRFEQYINYLGANGIECYHSWLLNEKDDSLFYAGSFFEKSFIAGKYFLKRIFQALDGTLRDADIVFVHREAFFLGPPFFEIIAKKYKKKIILDFDDAIWLAPVSNYNKSYAWLKWPSKTNTLLEISDLVLAGNPYLAEYAARFSRRIEIIPTTIDTEIYIPRPRSDRAAAPVCIGWSGSFSTISHFEKIVSALKVVKKEFGGEVEVKLIGDEHYRSPELQLEGLPWQISTEVSDLQTFDIGIMPLPDNSWARGKCGLKGLQYMALGIPTIMSPVGVNAEIITDGVNGFLASGEEEWVSKLALLIRDPELRDRVGKSGRDTVRVRYSVDAWKDRYLSLFKSLSQVPLN